MEDVWGSQAVDITKRRSYTQKFGDSTDSKSASEIAQSWSNAKNSSSPSSSSSSSSSSSITGTVSAKRNTFDLLLALAPSLFVILVFSGRPSLIVLCFGSLVCYILDLAGYPEPTLACVGLTILGIYCCAVWAARFLITEAFMNITIIATLGVLLLYLFFVVASGFVSLHLEFQRVVPHVERILFQSLPLLSSAFLSWFLCIEVSSLDLPICLHLLTLV